MGQWRGRDRNGFGLPILAVAWVHGIPIGEFALMHVDLRVQQQVELSMDLNLEVNQALTASIPRISDQIDRCLQNRPLGSKASQ